MTLRLNRDNVFDYLVEQELCKSPQQTLNNIEPITAKNPFGKSHRYSVMAGHNYNLNRENFTEKPIQNGHSKVG